MTATQVVASSTGTEATAYRRSVRQIVAGDWLPEYAAHAVTASVVDPDDGAVWVTLDDGRDIRLTCRKVWLVRTYAAPAWMADAVQNYRDARDARDAVRESSLPCPAGAVAGISGAPVSWCQLEDDDFLMAYPRPRLADYIREAAAARREIR